MRRAVGPAIVAWLLAVVGPAAAQAPLPVAERIATNLGRTTRVSLFTNRAAVVSVRSEHGEMVRQARLSEDEYMVYLQALDRLAREVGDEPVSSAVESRDSATTLTLHVGPDAPRTITYSPLASLNLAAGKIAAIMDDIELRVLDTRPGTDAVREWRPEVGDRVTLIHGTPARVTEVAEDGTVVLVEDDTGVVFAVGPEDRANVIRAPEPPLP